MRTVLLLSLLAILALAPASALADTYTACDSIPRTTFQDVNLVIQVPQFPYADCYLVDAQVVLDVAIDGRFFGENTGNCLPSGCAWNDSLYASLAFNDLDGTPHFTDFSFVDSGTLTSYDGVLDFGGTSGYTSPFAWTPYSAFTLTWDDLAIFDNPVPVTIGATAWTQLMNPGNGAFGVATYIQARVCVTYTYECPTAVERATWGGIKRLYRD